MILVADGIYYNEDDGFPYSSRRRKGKELKKIVSSSRGLLYIRVDKANKLWHRHVFEFFNGPTKNRIMHINGNNLDNRICNLQEEESKPKQKRLKQNKSEEESENEKLKRVLRMRQFEKDIKKTNLTKNRNLIK